MRPAPVSSYVRAFRKSLKLLVDPLLTCTTLYRPRVSSRREGALQVISRTAALNPDEEVGNRHHP